VKNKRKIVIVSILIGVVMVLCILLSRENVEKNKQIFIVNVLLNVRNNNLHNMRGVTGNTVEYSKDGKIEYVLNEKKSLINNDLMNGKLNFYFSIYEPLDHFIVDMLPFIKYGRPIEFTTKEERTDAYIEDFLAALDYLKVYWNNRIRLVGDKSKDNAYRFFKNVLDNEVFKNYKFSNRDAWFKDEKAYLQFKKDLKETLIAEFNK
jgi:hypothetical protein